MQSQQDRCYLPKIQRQDRGLREVGCQAFAIPSIRTHRPHHLRWYHGPRGGQTQARCRKGPRFLLLDGKYKQRDTNYHERCSHLGFPASGVEVISKDRSLNIPNSVLLTRIARILLMKNRLVYAKSQFDFMFP
ncbi:hypothetical protein EYC84_003592 [Monilinia fructicola]|uniref:Uncharacterized protein n=1 Tax=Monilinia fructicola TaxID=38448 RepID=A0A5M9K2C4_MONFR|nr:hypothetical protein EYC84_003592 [Monilinia fructicola]